MVERSAFKYLTISIIFAWIIAFVLCPNLIVVATSFLTRHEVDLVAFTFSLESYRKLFQPVFFTIFKDSFIYAFGTTAICLLIAYPFSYLLARKTITTRPATRRFLMILVIIPFWTSSLIRTYALIIILKANGIINATLHYIGLAEYIGAPFKLMYTDLAVFIGLVYTLMPFMILPIYASVEKLDKNLIEAARDLGAGTVQIFTRVIIPLTMPGIVAGCIIVFLPTMGLFYIPDLLGGAKTLLIGNFIKNQFLTARDWPFGSAASVLLTLIMCGTLLLYFRILKRFNRSLME